jgi:gamma-glutamylcyclotransferase (GGCT)/AIG2-like uncharacterized protein YtfP
MNEPLTKVFVYGTLQPGEVNYSICADWVIEIEPAIAYGQLFALPFGYPAMTSGTNPVYGVVLSFIDAAILEILDEFEQHEPTTFAFYTPNQLLEQNQYQRQRIPIFHHNGQPKSSAWAYLMTQTQIDRLVAVPIPDGRWKNYRATSISHYQTELDSVESVDLRDLTTIKNFN